MSASTDQVQEQLVVSVRIALESVFDPEMPSVNIEDLGILRDVTIEDGNIVVTTTPSYSACPAMCVIENDIEKVLGDAGFESVVVRTELAPAWSTDFITERGRRRLLDAGIAPPAARANAAVACPQCGSKNTEILSAFGATACKALYRCVDCLEPFDYFKCL